MPDQHFTSTKQLQTPVMHKIMMMNRSNCTKKKRGKRSGGEVGKRQSTRSVGAATRGFGNPKFASDGGHGKANPHRQINAIVDRFVLTSLEIPLLTFPLSFFCGVFDFSF